MSKEQFQSHFSIDKIVSSFRFTAPRTLTFRTVMGDFYTNDNFNPSNLPFDCHGLLHYEPETNTYLKQENVKQSNGENFVVPIELTDNEKLQTTQFLTKVLQTEELDISLPAFEREINNLYQGVFPLSVIKANDWGYTPIACELPLAKYNEKEDIWVSIKAIIREDGSYIIDPSSYCDQCVLFLSQEEWDTFPPPEQDPSSKKLIAYDFKQKKWVDSRTASQVYKMLLTNIQSTFDRLRYQNESFYLNLPLYSTNGLSIFTQKLMEIINTNFESQEEYQKIISNSEQEVYKNLKIEQNLTAADESSEDMLWRYNLYRSANSVLEGQQKAWENIINSSKQDVELYDNLSDTFEEWVENVYMLSV